MPTTRIVTLPSPMLFFINLLPPSVYYFSRATTGSLPLLEENYTLRDPPQDLPGYSIANSQDFYLTSNPQFIVPLFLNTSHAFFSEFDKYHEVTAIDVYRLDLISYKYYITVEYWWIIVLANNILDPFNIAIGTILRIPSEDTVVNEWLQSPVKKVRSPNEFFFGIT